MSKDEIPQSWLLTRMLASLLIPMFPMLGVGLVFGDSWLTTVSPIIAAVAVAMILRIIRSKLLGGFEYYTIVLWTGSALGSPGVDFGGWNFLTWVGDALYFGTLLAMIARIVILRRTWRTWRTADPLRAELHTLDTSGKREGG